MQRILPRYDLSTARTRTSGFGPPLIETPVSVELTGEGESPVRVPADRERVRRREQEAADAAQEPSDEASAGEDVDESAFTDDSLGTIIDIEA